MGRRLPAWRQLQKQLLCDTLLVQLLAAARPQALLLAPLQQATCCMPAPRCWARLCLQPRCFVAHQQDSAIDWRAALPRLAQSDRCRCFTAVVSGTAAGAPAASGIAAWDGSRAGSMLVRRQL